jgi:hypothetical protein
MNGSHYASKRKGMVKDTYYDPIYYAFGKTNYEQLDDIALQSEGSGFEKR